MKAVYKWRLQNTVYGYLTNEVGNSDPFVYDITQQTRIYYDGTIVTGSSVNDSLISNSVSKMTKQEYTDAFNKFKELVNLRYPQVFLLDIMYYYDVKNDECAASASSLKCSETDIKFEATAVTGDTISVEVTNIHTDPSVGDALEYRIDFTIPMGPQGHIGKTPDIRVGTVETVTLEPGESADVTITKDPDSSDEEPVFNFEFNIPRGEGVDIEGDLIVNVISATTTISESITANTVSANTIIVSSITADEFVRNGGTGDQYLMADGSITTLSAGTHISITKDSTTGVVTISSEGEQYDDGQNIRIDSDNKINAEGYYYDSGITSFAITGNTASGINSFANGIDTVASGFASSTEGIRTESIGMFSHAEGSVYLTQMKNLRELPNPVQDPDSSDVTYNFIDDHYQHDLTDRYYPSIGGATGYIYVPGFEYNPVHVVRSRYLVEGYTGDYLKIEGDDINFLKSRISGGTKFYFASSEHSGLTTSIGVSSHAEGGNTLAYGDYSHSEGLSTTACGFFSHAEGYNTVASGYSSHAEGYLTEASGVYSHAEGYHTIANEENMLAIGRYNESPSHCLFAVGDGDDEDGRKNVLTVKADYTDSTTAKVNNVYDVQLGLPIGSVTMWAGATGKQIPSGWLLCDGSDYNGKTNGQESEYFKLWDVIGTQYGGNGGSTCNFKVPNLVQRFPLGALSYGTIGKKHDGSTASSWSTTKGSYGGESGTTLWASESGLAPHRHGLIMNDQGNIDNGDYAVGREWNQSLRADYHKKMQSSSSATSWTGAWAMTEETCDASNPHNTIPPFVTIDFIIKYK